MNLNNRFLYEILNYWSKQTRKKEVSIHPSRPFTLLEGDSPLPKGDSPSRVNLLLRDPFTHTLKSNRHHSRLY
jgi:hypothetical protein